MKECADYRGLLVGLLDDELIADERRAVKEHLTRCASCRQEYERLRDTSGKLESITFREPGDDVLEQVWRTPYSRFTRNAGLWLVLGGFMLLIGYAIFELLASGREALPVKIGIAAAVIGFLIILWQLIRERIRTYKSDPYKEIER
jgi:anti-sigma factor RsiW